LWLLAHHNSTTINRSYPLIVASLESIYRIYYLLMVKDKSYHGKKNYHNKIKFTTVKNTLLFTIGNSKVSVVKFKTYHSKI
jgi:hypothetical protein